MKVVRVLPDVPAIDRSFDYSVPDTFGDRVRVGTMVRVPLAGRRVAGWVLETDVEPIEGVRLSPISKVVGHGPDPEVIELCRWAGWRWTGRLATMLRLASPERVVAQVPPLRTRVATGGTADEIAESLLMLGPGTHVLQVSPTTDALGIVVAAARRGQAIVVVPGIAEVERLARGLRAAGAAVARWPWDFQAAAGGATVVGGRGAVFAPAPALAAVVVLDEHDEMLQSESSPTWHAREVAVERARRAGVPCVLVSACPSLEALEAQSGDRSVLRAVGHGADRRGPSDHRGSTGLTTLGPPAGRAPLEPDSVDLGAIPLLRPPERVDVADPRGQFPRSVERRGWAPLTVVDRRGEDTGRTGLFSSRLVDDVRETARSGRQVICVLNRTGRARLLACRSCGTIAECEVCGAAVHQDDQRRLVCDRCEAVRPAVCLECGSTALSLLRVGVSRAREELEALVREPVLAVTGADPRRGAANGARGDDEEDIAEEGAARIVIGTEAALHRVHRAGLVAFLDLDQELLAPRYRAAEEALALLVLASRRVGGRAHGGSVLVQTRRPDHEVVAAALRADPSIVSRAEAPRRRLLGFPPAASIALVGGVAATAYIERVGEPEGVQVSESDDGQWLLRSRTPGRLQDHLATVERPPGRLRLQVDPARLRR
jgi:primosomal protein N' (replication factor Y) (superfamily II helicase)